jgi:hypothetical protein
MVMDFGTVNMENLSEKFYKLNNEGKFKGYNATYYRVRDDDHKKQSAKKTAAGIISLGILAFLSYKYVIRPISHTLRTILNIDEIREKEKKDDLSKIFRTDERIFDGKISKFDKSEAVTVDYTISQP